MQFCQVLSRISEASLATFVTAPNAFHLSLMNRLKDRAAIVTGGDSDFDEAICHRSTSQSAKVGVAHRDKASLPKSVIL